MLYRMIGERRMGITQPTHAWVSGQLARVWGNEAFGVVAPYPAVCLGAEQHDIGWIPWEMEPTLNLTTGYPHSFSEVPTATHVRIWGGAKRLAMPMGRYVALLVSLHGTGLYERFTHWKESPELTHLVTAFLQEEETFQRQLIQSLERDPAYAPYVTPATLTRNRRLIATWDALSLAICMGIKGSQQVTQVPAAGGETTLTLTPTADDPMQIAVEPWCFQPEAVTVVFEGRLLQERAEDELTMRDRISTAPWITLTTTLRPGQSRQSLSTGTLHRHELNASVMK